MPGWWKWKTRLTQDHLLLRVGSSPTPGTKKKKDNMNIDYYMSEAKKEALRAKITDWRIGAVMVRGGKIIGRGFNRYSAKSQMFAKKYNIDIFSLHAEMACIESCDNVENAILFVSGIKKNGRRVFCRPCKHCMKIIKLLPIKAVYYETKNGVEAIFFERK